MHNMLLVVTLEEAGGSIVWIGAAWSFGVDKETIEHARGIYLVPLQKEAGK